MSTTLVTATLRVLNSKLDRNGNTYWAFEFIDHVTGKSCAGALGGSARGNADSIRFGYSTPGEWDSSIRTEYVEMGKRDFDRLTKDYPYAHGSTNELSAWVKAQLAK
jgi:hypothetical protein